MSRYISKVEIRNFQSHKHTILNLDEGINLITGTSNAGKSAINRAIYWAISNKPAGDYFIRRGAPYAEVILTYSDGTQLIRFRGIEENYVKILYTDGTEIYKEKFGQEYPEEIKNFLSIPRDNKIIGNLFYAEQMSPLFLVNLSTSDLPRAIGFLAGSDVMEFAYKEMMQDSRQIKRDADKNQTEIKKIELELKKFTNLDNKLLLLEECKGIKEKLDSLTNIKNDIENTKIKRDLTHESIQLICQRLKDLKQLSNLTEDIDIIKSICSDYNTINTMLNSTNSTKTNINRIKEKASLFSEFFKSYKKTSLNDLKKTLPLIKDIQGISDTHYKHMESVNYIKNRLYDIESETLVAKKEVKVLKKKLLESDFICKTCGQKIIK